jgi:Na+-driven multidrug efflux pump
VIRKPRAAKVWQDVKLIIGNGWKVSAQTFLELAAFFGGMTGYAYLRGEDAQVAVRIGLTWDAVANLFQGPWSRGMQRLMPYDMRISEKTKIVFRGIFMTLAFGAIPLLIGEFFPQELTRVFTNSTAVLKESDVVMRALFGGQYFYGLTAITQFALWLLFDDTGFALTASAATAAVFFAVTLPLLLEDVENFDITTMAFVGCMAANAFATLGWYARRVRNGGDIPQAENMRSRGLFGCCGKPKVRAPEETLLHDSSEFKGTAPATLN